MILYIKILFVLAAFLLPWAYTVKKARLEVTLGFSFMLGISTLRTEYAIKEELYDRYDILFCLGPLNFSTTWLSKKNA